MNSYGAYVSGHTKGLCIIDQIRCRLAAENFYIFVSSKLLLKILIRMPNCLYHCDCKLLTLPEPLVYEPMLNPGLYLAQNVGKGKDKQCLVTEAIRTNILPLKPIFQKLSVNYV